MGKLEEARANAAEARAALEWARARWALEGKPAIHHAVKALEKHWRNAAENYQRIAEYAALAPVGDPLLVHIPPVGAGLPARSNGQDEEDGGDERGGE